MTGFVQTSSEGTRPRCSSSLVVSCLVLGDLSSLSDGRSIAYSGRCLYILYIIFSRNNFIDSLLWLAVGPGLYKEDYLQILKCVSFSLHSCCVKWEGWVPVNRFNHTSWVAIVTPTDRPKVICNRCVIDGLVALLCCHVAFWILLLV